MMEQATLSGIQAQLIDALGEFVQLLPAAMLGRQVFEELAPWIPSTSTTTRRRRATLQWWRAMLPFFSEQFGNPSSMHSFGSQVGLAVKEARSRVQTLLGAEHDSEIVFTSCGTESDSTAILSALKAQPPSAIKSSPPPSSTRRF